MTDRKGWDGNRNTQVTALVCVCGKDLLKEFAQDNIVSHEEIVECLSCGRRYQFIWIGMTVKELR